MAECSMIQRCPFFADKMRGMPANATHLKEQYCVDDFKTCARYLVGSQLGEAKIPGNLFPNQNERARVLVAART
ncbi:MAG TPA: hypothetical protein VMV68_04270 [Spirochaetia bacterium]|nr:hypothetical protein [Spirochaetia bacterium]